MGFLQSVNLTMGPVLSSVGTLVIMVTMTQVGESSCSVYYLLTSEIRSSSSLSVRVTAQNDTLLQ